MIAIPLLCVWLTACSRQQKAQELESIFQTPQIHAVQLTRCPRGHTNLVDVPLEYGLVELTDDLRTRIDNHEIVLAGCVVSPDGHSTSVVRCAQCNLVFNHPRALAAWLDLETMKEVQPEN